MAHANQSLEVFQKMGISGKSRSKMAEERDTWVPSMMKLKPLKPMTITPFYIKVLKQRLTSITM